MERLSRTSNFIIMGLIIVAVIIGTVMRKPITVDFNLNLNKIDVANVISSIKKNIEAEPEDQLYIKNMDVNSKGEEVPNNGDPAFNITISKDGVIYRILWNMTFKDQYDTYNIFQSSGGKQIRKGNSELILNKIGKSDDIGNKNILLKDALEALRILPWSTIEKELPESDFYMMRLERFNSQSSEIKSKSLLYVDIDGDVNKISADDISNIKGNTLVFPVALSDDKGHGEDSGFIILVEVKE